MPSFSNIRLSLPGSGSEITSSFSVLPVYYGSPEYGTFSDAATMGSIEALVTNYDNTGSYGELIFRAPSFEDRASTGSKLLTISSTGSNGEPRVGIGFGDDEKPLRAFEVKTKTDSAEGSEFLIRSSRLTEGAQVGDLGGAIRFSIDSASFKDVTTSGSVALIDSIVTTVESEGVTGDLAFNVATSARLAPTEMVRLRGDGNRVDITGSLRTTNGTRLGTSTFNTHTLTGSVNVHGTIDSSGDVDIAGQLSINGFSDVSASLATIPTNNNQLTNGAGYTTNTGTVDTSGTPANNQLAIFTDPDTIEGDSDLTWDGSIFTVNGTASVDLLQVDDKLQGNGSGFQFFAFNEDTTKVKFANWFTGTDNQYGMGMLWYETWFAAIDTDGNANDVNRRIGFYLEQPEAGATDSTSGETGRHPNNARFYIDVTGSYVASGGLHVTDADFNVESDGNVEVNGNISVTGTVDGVDVSTLNISGAGDFVNNEFIVAVGTNAVTSSDALAVDSAGNLGIGTSTPEVRLHMVGEGSQTSQILMEQYNDNQDAPDIRTRRYRGTEAAPADVQTGDYLFRLNVHGQDGGSSELYGSMRFDVDGTDQDALEWGLQTRDTTGTVADRITIDSAGDTIIAGEVSSNTIKNIETTLASDSATNVDTFATATYKGAIYDYVLYDAGVGARTGQFMVIQDNSNIDFTDNSTPTIGSEATIPSITAVINGSNVEVKVTNGNGYTFKAMVKKL